MKWNFSGNIFPSAFLKEQRVFNIAFLNILVFFGKQKLFLFVTRNVSEKQKKLV